MSDEDAENIVGAMLGASVPRSGEEIGVDSQMYSVMVPDSESD